MSHKAKLRLSFLIAILSWLLYTFFDLYFIILDKYEITEAYVAFLPQLFYSLFVLSVLFYYRYLITKAESLNFLDLLWRVFITGLVTTILSFGIQFILSEFADTALIKNAFTINLFYHIYTALVIVYLVSTFIVWKRLILYQKSKNLIQLWNFFEYALMLILVFDFFNYQLQDRAFYIALVFLTSFSLVLSFNLKWIAYLNFKQKWKSILFILLSGIYLYHFYVNLSNFSSRGVLTYDLLDRVFVIEVLIFIFIYAIISVLVTLFNLPTSSVFERKLKEAVDYQKLSQAVPAGQSENETYDVLIDSSMSAVFADAAWIEIKQSGSQSTLITRRITREEVAEVKNLLKSEKILEVVMLKYKDFVQPQKVFTTIGKNAYRSVFALPIMVKNEQIGALVLLQEVADAFNREMVNIITTFVNQAGISIENARLLNEAIENERYKEQLKIAKIVQKSLLPEQLHSNESFSLTAFSAAAEEVGGDYYDTIALAEDKFGLIIGDVSGKGTSAAFNMAQMKGIFHSLNHLSPEQFVIKANGALSHCLEKSSFITASYYVIDTTKKTVEFVRAGHCPTLVYQAKNNEAHYLKTEGLGLGIVRNHDYKKYVHTNTITYESNDVIILYTDGITEATNSQNDQFGDQRLRTALLNHAVKSPEQISKGIIDELHDFLEGEELDDDYTLVILKFN